MGGEADAALGPAGDKLPFIQPRVIARLSIIRQRFSRSLGQFTMLSGDATLLLKHIYNLELFPTNILIVPNVWRKDVPARRHGGATVETPGPVRGGRSHMSSTRDRESNSKARDQTCYRNKGRSQAGKTHHWIRLSPSVRPTTRSFSRTRGHS
jgi:hypothetical protein